MQEFQNADSAANCKAFARSKPARPKVVDEHGSTFTSLARIMLLSSPEPILKPRLNLSKRRLVLNLLNLDPLRISDLGSARQPNASHDDFGVNLGRH